MARDGSLICRRIKRQNLSRNGEGVGKEQIAKACNVHLHDFLVSFVFGRRARQEEEKRKFVRRWRIFNGQTERENRLNRSFPLFFSSFPCCLLGKRIFFPFARTRNPIHLFFEPTEMLGRKWTMCFFFFVFLFPFSIFQQQLIYSQTKNAAKLWKRGKLKKKKTCLAFCSNYECSCRSLRCSFVCIGKASAMFNDRDAHVDALDGTLMTHAAFGEHLRDRRDR